MVAAGQTFPRCRGDIHSNCIYPVLPCSSVSTLVLLALVCLSGRCCGLRRASGSGLLLCGDAWKGPPLPSCACCPSSLDSSVVDFYVCSRALRACFSFPQRLILQEEVVNHREECAAYLLVRSACLTSVHDQIGISGAVEWDKRETVHYCYVVEMVFIITSQRRWKDEIDFEKRLVRCSSSVGVAACFLSAEWTFTGYDLYFQLSPACSSCFPSIISPNPSCSRELQISLKMPPKKKTTSCISLYVFFKKGHGGVL